MYCDAVLTEDITDTYRWAEQQPDMVLELACDMCYIPF